MILSFLFYAFLIYLAYKVVFSFVLPVYRATKQVRKGFREMEERMRGPAGPPHGATEARAGSRPQPSVSSAPSQPGDYIDFEEIK